MGWETRKRKRDEEYAAYYRQHKACPRCGNQSMEQTCVGCDVINGGDNNEVRCPCGWWGIVDDLVPAEVNDEYSN